MKKKLFGLLLLITLIFGITTVKAKIYTLDEIPKGTYVIGNHLFVRNGEHSDDYKGTLYMEHIMNAAKTNQAESYDEEKIYEKSSNGNWYDPIDAQPIELPEDMTFEIYWINMLLIDDFIYGDANGDGVGVVNTDSTSVTSTYGIADYHGVDDETKENTLNNAIADLKALSIAVSENKVFSDVELIGLDLNEDKTVDINDVIILHKHFFGEVGYEHLPIVGKIETEIYGEADGLEEITEDDAILALQYSMFNQLYEVVNPILIDINLDLVVDMNDALGILQST